MPISGKMPIPKISSQLRTIFRITDITPIAELSFALPQTFIIPKYTCVKPVRTNENETVRKYLAPSVIKTGDDVKNCIISSGISAVPSVNTIPTIKV